jgi:hypothetical protein
MKVGDLVRSMLPNLGVPGDYGVVLHFEDKWYTQYTTWKEGLDIIVLWTAYNPPLQTREEVNNIEVISESG